MRRAALLEFRDRRPRLPGLTVLFATALLLGTGHATAFAQSQGPTMRDWWRGSAAAGGAVPAATSTPTRTESPRAPSAGDEAAAPPPRFYVRTDFAFGLQLDIDQTAANCSASTIIELCGYSARGNAGDSLGGTVGFGYRLTPWLRGDASFAFRQGRRAAGGIDSFDGLPSAGTIALRTRAYTLMFNLYVHVVPAFGGSEGWFQPYVGAGIGPSFNHVDSSAIAGTFPGGIAAAQLGSATTTSFAWNATGGIALRLSRNLGVDLGYRYVDLGSFETGSGTAQPSGAAIDAVHLKTRLHELYLGFRIAFN